MTLAGIVREAVRLACLTFNVEKLNSGAVIYAVVRDDVMTKGLNR